MEMRNKGKVFIFIILLAVIVFTNPACALEPSELAFPGDVLVPKADSVSELEGDPPHYKVYEDKNGKKEIAGICYVVSARGFSSNIRIMVGVNVDHTLAGIRVLQHREPIARSLGDFLRTSLYYNRYEGKNINAEFRVRHDDIDAISGATITVEAVVTAVRDSSRQIAQAYLPTEEIYGYSKTMYSEKMYWSQLMDDGSIVKINTMGGKDFIGLSLYFAYVNPPLIGRSILGLGVYNDIMLEYGTNQLFFVGITGSYAYLFDSSNILIAQGENRIPVNEYDFIPVEASGGIISFKSQGIIRLQDKVDFTKPVTIVIHYATEMGTFSKEYKLLDKYLVSEEN